VAWFDFNGCEMRTQRNQIKPHAVTPTLQLSAASSTAHASPHAETTSYKQPGSTQHLNGPHHPHRRYGTTKSCALPDFVHS
jgi:hypothetical protein